MLSLTSDLSHIISLPRTIGVPPRDSSILINALLIHHYKRGAYYPKGGASEISYHISNTIRKYGGDVLVRAPVCQVLLDKDGAACGEHQPGEKDGPFSLVYLESKMAPLV